MTSLRHLTAANIRRLELLGSIIELGGGVEGDSVSSFQLRDHLGDATDLGTINEDLKILGREGHILVDVRFGGASSAFMKGPGVDAWTAFVQARSSVIERRIELRDIYLKWLYEEIEGHGRRPSQGGFLSAGLSYFGLPYTEADVAKAGEWLLNNGFIAGKGAWGVPSPLRPTLTPKGQAVIDSGRSVSAPESASASIVNNTFTNNVHAPSNIAQGNHSVEQALSNSAPWLAEAQALASAIEQSLPALGLEVQAEVVQVNAELQAELAGPANPGRVRALVTAMGDSFAKGGAGALGGVFGSQLGALLLSLPS